ncbi:unnamed protein product [Leuciscus chuanchicus]
MAGVDGLCDSAEASGPPPQGRPCAAAILCSGGALPRAGMIPVLQGSLSWSWSAREEYIPCDGKLAPARRTEERQYGKQSKLFCSFTEPASTNFPIAHPSASAI